MEKNELMLIKLTELTNLKWEHNDDVSKLLSNQMKLIPLTNKEHNIEVVVLSNKVMLLVHAELTVQLKYMDSLVEEIAKIKFADQKNEQLMWNHIHLLNWESNPDYERVREFLDSTYTAGFQTDLENFSRLKQNELKDKFEKQWLSDPGIQCSDDSWGDLTADCVGRGRAFYEDVTTFKLQKMAKDLLYTENFMYSFL